jgi:hypothetical protein
MKEIPLTQGKVALVDDADYEALAKHKWSFSHGYAKRSDANRKTVYMHRQLLGVVGGIIDHKNGSGIDNRRSNLRIADKRLNGINRGKNRNNKSGYKGVQYAGGNKPWVATIACNRKRIYSERFPTAEAAARAYKRKLTEVYGEFASV